MVNSARVFMLCFILTACSATTGVVPTPRFVEYERQLEVTGHGLLPVAKRPTVFIDTTHPVIVRAAHKAMVEINRVLPARIKLTTVEAPHLASITLQSASAQETHRFCGEETPTCALSIVDKSAGITKRTRILTADNISTWKNDHIDMSLGNAVDVAILHEFLHAVGIQGHVSVKTFPNSVMGHGALFNSGYELPEIDASLLKVMYW